MKVIFRLFRVIHISYVLCKYGLDEIALSLPIFRPIRFLLIFSLSRITGIYRKPKGERIRQTLEELGPIFVKFGQVLSTRADIFPPDIIQELAKLQDQVPPFCGKKASKMIEESLEQPLKIFFKHFDETPLASASIAQVHAATLLDGKEVVVKVLRPNIAKLIRRDIELLKTLASLLARYSKKVRIFKPEAMVLEFEKTLLDELNLVREASNASQLRRHFHHSSDLYIPEIHWPLCKKNVLVMERIFGVSLCDLTTLKSQGFNLKALAELILDIFFTQVFRDCFFHADCHPGNLFVTQNEQHRPKLIYVDFGIMGSLTAHDKRYLAENFLAFFNRDYQKVAELHRECAWIPNYIRLDEFEANIRLVCEPIFERPLHEISFGTLLFNLFQTAERFHVNIQPQLILLQKTLLNVEGIARTLYPDLDLWRTLSLSLEKWTKKELGPKAFLRKLKTLAPYWLEKLPEIPELILDLLENKSQQGVQRELLPMDAPVQVKTSKKELWFGMLIGIGLTLCWVAIKGNFAWLTAFSVK